MIENIFSFAKETEGYILLEVKVKARDTIFYPYLNQEMCNILIRKDENSILIIEKNGKKYFIPKEAERKYLETQLAEAIANYIFKKTHLKNVFCNGVHMINTKEFLKDCN